jgi:sugar/nucleoside kinase (ribokinase family)
MPKEKTTPPAYVGFGMLTPVAIMVIDRLPKHNTGALVNQLSEFVFDDAAIIACILRQWDMPSGMIGTAVGDDPRGHALADQLKEWGVQGEVRFSKKFKTPLEVDVSDKTGARTFFWQRPREALNTLDTADLSLLKGASLMYADWYDGDHIIRAMDEANRLNVPVFLNMEHGHKESSILKKYAGRVTICQAVTDAAQLGRTNAMLNVARKLLKSGIRTAVITMASQGCLAVQGETIIRVHAPKVKAVDGCGAGATFSAGYIYGYLKGWSLEESVRFAIAAASLKVTRAGLKMFPIKEIKALARTLKVDHVLYKDNQFFKIDRLLPFRENDFVREGRKFAEKILPKKKNQEKEKTIRRKLV